MFETFADVPAYPLVFPLFWGAVVVFALVMARHLRVFAAVRADGPNPLADVPRRTAGLVRYAFLQTKMFKDRRAGVMHVGIFWGFVLLTIGTANIVTGGLIQAVISWPLDGVLWAAVSAMQNVVALITLVAVGWAFFRRLVTRPARLTLNRSSLVILAMIGGVVATELLAQAFEAARYGDIPGAFVANALAVPLRALGTSVTEAGFAVLWWAHIALVAAFLIYLPFSKHLHIATSFFNVYFRKLAPRGELPAMDLEDETATFGLRTLQDLGWKDLLDGFTCTECGRCQEACPANTGKPLNPKTFIMGIREMSVEAEHGIDLIPNSPIVPETYGLDDTAPDPGRLGQPIVDAAIPYDAVWDCVTCGACVEACPVLIEHVDKIVGLRRNLVLEESRFPGELTAAFRTWRARATRGASRRPPGPTGRRGSRSRSRPSPRLRPPAGSTSSRSSTGSAAPRRSTSATSRSPGRSRPASTRPASGSRSSARRSRAPATRPAGWATTTSTRSSRRATSRRSTATRCEDASSPPARTASTRSATSTASSAGGTRSSTTQRTCAGSWPRGGCARSTPTEAIQRPPGRVTFHDSCYLARYNDVVAAPRDVLGAVPGLALIEMDRNGKNTFCCGAGGGRMWMEETRGTRINEERTRQVLETGAGTVATSCPFCMVMMSDGLAAAEGNAAGVVSAVDIAELLAETVDPTRSGGRQLPVLQ